MHVNSPVKTFVSSCWLRPLILALLLTPIAASNVKAQEASGQEAKAQEAGAEEASAQKTPDLRPWRAMISGPMPCTCLQTDIGYAVSEDVVVGLNYYRGAGFLFARYFAEQYGIFTSYKLLSSSFFIQLRLGQMNTTEDKLRSKEEVYPRIYEKIRDYGPSWGADFGNEWQLTSRLFHRFTWLGKDDYFKPSKSTPLVHFIRYQFGVRF